MKEYKIIAVTHHTTPLEEVGKYHISPEDRKERLEYLRNALKLQELFYLSTCNRVEFLFVTDQPLDGHFAQLFFRAFQPGWTASQIGQAVAEVRLLEGDAAVKHLFHVAASLDSLVVGEREIISQVRTAYDEAVKYGLAGDHIRLLMRKVIESAKEVFTATPISRNPVSVVSLAYRKLKSLHIKPDARILIVGAGQTNVNMCKYLKKHGFGNFTVFNRSLPKAQELAATLEGTAYTLDELDCYSGGFDVLLSCTAASGYMITPERYEQLLQRDTGRKVVVDLAIPYDVDPGIYDRFPVHAILVESLRQAAEENLALRRDALCQCEDIVDAHRAEFRNMYRERRIERAMKEVPRKVKEIRQHTVESVFAREFGSLDEQSRGVVERMLSYMEKKYISVPMKMAKEILLDSGAEP